MVNKIKELESYRKYLSFKIKSNLINSCLDDLDKLNWVDIENAYFKELLRFYDKDKNTFNKVGVEEVNEHFEFLKSELDKYLQMVQLNLKFFEPNEEFMDVFNAPMKRSEIIEVNHEDMRLMYSKDGNDVIIDRTIFLNFNYTNTIRAYHEKGIIKNSEIINIHGQLNSDSNPIVFGFGDEHNEIYKKFETANTNKVFKHIKSYYYLKTRNYHDLIGKINFDNYQVMIVGHSCGLSDRTMLREIFEHKNCVSIKIVPHVNAGGKSNYTNLTYDISRHFTDKGMMRKKILDETNCLKMPKIEIEQLNIFDLTP